MNPAVTLAVSVYNVAPYIERCVRSLFEQTFDNIEFLFVDDCSPDNSMDIMWRILEEYPNRKPRVKVVRHGHNAGTAVTKRDCFMHATGDYVLIIDSDDYVELTMVEKMYRKAEETHADMVVCEILKESLQGYKILSSAPRGIHGNGENVKDDIINRYVTPSLSCKILKRSIFVDNEIAWPTSDFAEDYVISTEAAFYTHQIAAVDEPLYHYCYNQDSICSTRTEANILDKYYGFKANFDIVIKFLEDKGVAEKYEDGIFRNKVRAKTMLNSLLDQRKYRKLWLKTYPEVNRSFLLGDKYRKPSYRERFWFLALSMGLYPKYKRRIYSKRFKPRDEWMPILN